MKTCTASLLSLALVASGCSVFAPRPDMSRYFLLRPLAEADGGPGLDGLVLAVGPVSVPDHLDRIEMVEPVGPYEVRFSTERRWVEPLGLQLQRVLAENLTVLLSPDRVVAYPWHATDRAGLQVEWTFEPFRMDDAGVWSGKVSWRLRDGSTREERENGVFFLDLGMPPVDGDGVASRLSDEVRRMSEEVAAAVRRQYGMRS
jgi:uncharacterized lipoprotein YmbA